MFEHLSVQLALLSYSQWSLCILSSIGEHQLSIICHLGGRTISPIVSQFMPVFPVELLIALSFSKTSSFGQQVKCVQGTDVSFNWYGWWVTAVETKKRLSGAWNCQAWLHGRFQIGIVPGRMARKQEGLFGWRKSHVQRDKDGTVIQANCDGRFRWENIQR